jgi:hypothetical protein
MAKRKTDSAYCFWLLFVFCVLEFLIILHLVIGKCPRVPTDACDCTNYKAINEKALNVDKKTEMRALNPEISLASVINFSQSGHRHIAGAAVTLFLHAPAWFQRRYSLMIQNTVGNIPDDWIVQVFYTPQGSSQYGLDINPGIQHYIETGKVILTKISDEVFKTKRKRFELMVEPWIWENMLSEKVLIFGGTCVICSNSPYSFANFSEFDYIGAPWNFRKGVGGDGLISLRNRTLMLAALNFELMKYEPSKRKDAYKTFGQEDQFFVSRLLELQKIGMPNIRLATREDTLRFGAINNYINNDVLVVSGTLAEVPFIERDKFVSFCPEIKMFYPVLHDPSCFGATPNGTVCASTICALRPKTQRKGGC